MGKYGDFNVVRTERRVPKRSPDPNVDADGMREYSFLRCPHCKIENIEIASSAIRTGKSLVVQEHIAVCPAYIGERPTKRCKEKKESTALVIKTPVENDESIESRLARMERENLEMKEELGQVKGTVGQLKDKTSLYDSVLRAVMPSLALPLMAPEETAKITLREAAIKDLKPSAMTLALTAPTDVVPREMHTAMIEQKDQMFDHMLAVEKERREELKEELKAKDSELHKAIQEREVASLRAEKLQRERDVLKAKIDKELKSQIKHVSSPPNKLEQGLKRSISERMAMEASTAAAVAIEKEFAAKRGKN